MAKHKRFMLICVLQLICFQTSAGCTAPSFEWALRSGQYYRLYQVSLSFDEAAKTCANDGARLAMMRNQQEFDDAKAVIASGSYTWIGLLNHEMVYCSDKNNCYGKFSWADGSPVEDEDLARFSTVDGNGAQYCVRIFDGNRVGDRDCTKLHQFLCQYDCDDPLDAVAEKAEQCPDAPSGFDLIFSGSAFKTYTYTTTYEQAQQTCLMEGGHLPVVSNYDEYKAARTIAGFGSSPIWLGLQSKDASVACSNTATCAGKLHHHRPGLTPIAFDDRYWDFEEEPWFTLQMNMQGSQGLCVTMDDAQHSSAGNQNRLASKACGVAVRFVCAVSCTDSFVPAVSVCPEPPAVGTNMLSSDWLAGTLTTVDLQVTDIPMAKTTC